MSYNIAWHNGCLADYERDVKSVVFVLNGKDYSKKAQTLTRRWLKTEDLFELKPRKRKYMD